MRTIERTNQFKRDYKRELKGPYRATLEDDFRQVAGDVGKRSTVAGAATRPCANRELERFPGLSH